MESTNTSNANTLTITTTDIQSDQQDQLEQLKRDGAEKEASLDKISADVSNSIIHFNVGGKKLSTSRKILTMIEDTLLSTIISDECNKRLVKDIDGAFFLDYDPVLFKHLINQLRYWSLNPLATRVFSLPIENKNEFISLVRSLKFDERYLTDTFSENVNSNVKVIDNQRLCVKTSEDQHLAYVAGNLLYFEGKHFIKLMLTLTNMQIGFIGIRPANLPIEIKSIKNSFPIPYTFGIDNKCLVMNGTCTSYFSAWQTFTPKNTFLIELDCDSRTMHITRDHPIPMATFYRIERQK
ncbi:unnamed protein product [Rotaria sp. Silwood1]|nr:unnamed protein product [Rotaria sp. Silwood1]